MDTYRILEQGKHDVPDLPTYPPLLQTLTITTPFISLFDKTG